MKLEKVNQNIKKRQLKYSVKDISKEIIHNNYQKIVQNMKESFDARNPICMGVEEYRKATEQLSQVTSPSVATEELKSPRAVETSSSPPWSDPVNSPVRDDDIGSYVARLQPMCFDKIKIRVSYPNGKLQPFEVIDKNKFGKRLKNGIAYYEYKHRTKNIYIRYGEIGTNKELCAIDVEFTSSIIEGRELELISEQNISDILKSLDTEYQTIRIKDVKHFINNAYVYCCDVTKDQFLTEDEAKLFQTFTYTNRKNTREAKVDLRKGVNFILENKVKSASVRKLRLTFYDKYKKLLIDERYNRLPFGFNLNAQKGKHRLELNLKNPQLIKEYLNIRDNSLRLVLSSQAQPILKFYGEMIQFPRDTQPMITRDLKYYMKYLLAKDCGFDLAKIEEILRSYQTPWRTTLLTPYVDICNEHGQLRKKMQEYVKKVKDMLTIKYEKCKIFAKLFPQASYGTEIVL